MKTSGQRRSLYVQAIVLFFVAALPRLVDLAAFVNPDERRWLDRSPDLLRALSTGDLSLAYHSGNPAGIITKWCGLASIWGRYLLHSLGWRAHLDLGMAASRDLWTFLEAIQKQPQNILDVLAGMGLVKGMEYLWGRARTEVRSIHPGKGLGFKP